MTTYFHASAEELTAHDGSGPLAAQADGRVFLRSFQQDAGLQDARQRRRLGMQLANSRE